MIEKLRRKFILISIGAVFAVLTVVMVILNLSNYYEMNRHATNLATIILENGGHFPKPPMGERPKETENPSLNKANSEAPYSTRFFTISLDNTGHITTVDTGKVVSVSTTEAIAYTKKILEEGRDEGYIDYYKYKVETNANQQLIVFVDCQRDLDLFWSFLMNTIIISLLSLSAFFFLVLIFSKKAIGPVAESYEKQKRFITDASHELKTPLAIILANTEVIEMDYGESQWTKSTKNQIQGLSTLVTGMVSLARMNEEKTEVAMKTFSLSNTVEESATPFVALAKAQQKSLNINIEENVSYCGNEEKIRQLISILLDNAVKYSKENSAIFLTLNKQGKKYYLTVENETENVKQGNLDVLFQRFYRMDASRNRQNGGYGIGLSIAEAIVSQHKEKITAESPNGNEIIITVVL